MPPLQLLRSRSMQPSLGWRIQQNTRTEQCRCTYHGVRLLAVGIRKERATMRGLVVKGCQEGGDLKNKRERRSFLSLEEAGLVEMSGLSSHERFLCRLTVSSLNLLRVISEEEGTTIEELNAGRICDWFLKDKLKREQDIDSAVLQWDESEFVL